MNVGNFRFASVDCHIPGHGIGDQPPQGAAETGQVGFVVFLSVSSVLEVPIGINVVGREFG